MKRLLAILGVFGLTATGATSVVACNTQQSEFQGLKNRISVLKEKVNNLKNITEFERKAILNSLLEIEMSLNHLTDEEIKNLSKKQLDFFKAGLDMIEEALNKLS